MSTQVDVDNLPRMMLSFRSTDFHSLKTVNETYDYTIQQWMEANDTSYLINQRKLTKNLIRYYKEVLLKVPEISYVTNKNGNRSVNYVFTAEDDKHIRHVYTQLLQIEISTQLLNSHALV